MFKISGFAGLGEITQWDCIRHPNGYFWCSKDGVARPYSSYDGGKGPACWAPGCVVPAEGTADINGYPTTSFQQTSPPPQQAQQAAPQQAQATLLSSLVSNPDVLRQAQALGVPPEAIVAGQKAATAYGSGSSATSSFLQAQRAYQQSQHKSPLPWVLGGVAALVGLAVIVKKRKSKAA